MSADRVQHDSIWNQIFLAAAKWYIPVAADVLSFGELQPLEQQTDAQDVMLRSRVPVIAYPTLVSPRPVLGRDPLELGGFFFSPLIIRLHYVAQLSTTYLRGNVDAKHPRLSHALGSLSVLSVIMDILVPKLRGQPDLEQCLPSNSEIVSAFTYTAVHDAFQGPFGHVLDALREDLVGALHAERRLDKTLLNFIFGIAVNYLSRENPSPPTAVMALCDVLDKTIARPLRVPLLELVQWIYDASSASDASMTPDRKERRRQMGWLYELLEGPIDADRWDYLWRDTLHLGFTKNNEEITQLFKDFLLDVSVLWDGARSRIAVSEPIARRLGRSFFGLRRNLYRQVYEGPEKRVVDAILVRSIFLGLLNPTGRYVEDSAKGEQMYGGLVINFTHITDSELLSILEGVNNPLIAHLVRELRTYPAIRIAWDCSITDGEYRSILGLHPKTIDAFAFKGTVPPKWARSADASLDKEANLEEVLEESYARLHMPGELAVIGTSSLLSLILHCTVLSTRVSRLLQFERVVWRLLLRELSPAVVAEIEKSVQERISSLSLFRGDVSLSLGRCPPIFVSFPWVPISSSNAMKEIAREPGERKVCVRQGRSFVEKSPGELMPHVDAEAAYTIVAGYPSFVAAGLSEDDRQTFGSMLKAVLEALIKYGCCLALPGEFVREEYDQSIVAFVARMIERELREKRGS